MKNLLLTLLFLCGCPALPAEYDLGIHYQKQVRSQWCWAAVDSMVWEFFGEDRSQSDLVEMVFGRAYDYAAGLEAGLPGLADKYTRGQVSDFLVRNALWNDHPVVLGYSGPTGSHFVLLAGYNEDYFTVYDPAGEISYATYEELARNEDKVWDETHEISRISP